MVLNLSPIFTALLSWVLLGEILSMIQVLGMIVVIVGVVFVQRFKDPGHLNA